ncbi:MAG: MFS transporter [Trueperaceae bacterium]
MLLRRGLRAGYYGWRVVAALSVTETISYGILAYAFTVFVAPMQAEFGWSLATITGALSLSLLVSGVASLPVGRWLDAHGPRLLMSVGSVAAAVLLLAWSYVDTLFAYYLVWFGLGITQAAVLYDPAFAALAVWFRRRRGLALTVLTFVAGFASVIFIPLAGQLLEVHGWRVAVRWLAAILAVGTIPLHALVLRRRPADLGLQPDGAAEKVASTLTPSARTRPGRSAHVTDEPSLTANEAFATPAFRWLTVAFGLSNFVISALAVHIVPLLLVSGREPAQAAFIGGAVGLMALPGRVIFTPLGDVVPRFVIAALLFTTQAAGVSMLLFGTSDALLWAFVLVYGLGFGAITPARAALVADTFGAAHFGRINARMAMVQAGARAAAPVTVGALVTLTQGYATSLVLMVTMAALAAVSVLFAGRKPAG